MGQVPGVCFSWKVFFFFLAALAGLRIATCGPLVTRPGIEPVPSAVEIRILASLVAQLVKNLPTVQKTSV